MDERPEGMHIYILTLFEEMFKGPFDHSIINRAIDGGFINIEFHNIRNYTHDRHRSVDDYQYGGGSGMVMKPEPIFEGVEGILSRIPDLQRNETKVVLMSPQGRMFTQAVAEELSNSQHLILLCGHYNGVDERVRGHLITDELSIGDYVLTGGELASMVVVDAVSRLIPGVVGSQENIQQDSITSGLLQHPIYTHPAIYQDHSVPEVLLSGDHEQIRRWRRTQSLRRTLEKRPDLLMKADLSEEDLQFLASLGFKRE